ncbi:MAG: hypothetical protein KGI38_12515 [Thaumarchaeota archaeon]|nr:hypothetical protein [Nitrososphaerota archaeon]
MTDAPTAASAAIESKTTDGFLTKDALTSGRTFKTEEDSLYVPELGGKLLLRGVSFREQRQIQANLPDTIQGFKIEHTAFTLSKYVKQPVLTQDEWTKVLSKDGSDGGKPFPAKAVTRINKKIAEIVDISDEEEEAAASEFPGS